MFIGLIIDDEGGLIMVIICYATNDPIIDHNAYNNWYFRIGTTINRHGRVAVIRDDNSDRSTAFPVSNSGANSNYRFIIIDDMNDICDNVEVGDNSMGARSNYMLNEYDEGRARIFGSTRYS